MALIWKFNLAYIKIDAINADPATQGIIMTPQKLDDFDIDFKPTYIITNQSVDKNLTGVASANSINDLVKVGMI